MTTELTDEQIRQVLQGISVPPQPQIMVDLQMEQVMPEPDLRTIARLISQDPGLSGALLKTVNSPFFGQAKRVGSIQQAVNLLGCNTVINLINAQSIKGAMSDATIVSLNRFWDTAQDVAMASMALAKRLRYPAPDEAYTVGLFHNCGIPLMLKRFPQYMQVLAEAYARVDQDTRIADVENQHLTTNHAVVGYYTARSWKLPAHLCDVIAQHHSVAALFADEFAPAKTKTLLAILKMAEHICGCHRVLGNQAVDHEWEAIADLVLDFLQLTEYDFDGLKHGLEELGLG